MREMVLLCAACSALMICFSIEAGTYEVSQRHQQASDEGPGTTERPWKTVSHAASKVAAGDTVTIREGTYRERVVIKAEGRADAPIQFVAAPGARVVLTGADHLTGWQKAESSRPVYQAAWPHRFITWSKTMTHPDDEYHRVIGRCEQVIIDGYMLRQVLERTQLAPGAFWVDVTNQLLLVWDSGNRDVNKTLAEASVRQEIVRVEGAHVQLRGIQFRFAANAAQHGAVVLAGRNSVIEDCVAEFMNSSGAVFSGEDQVVRRCVFRDNGQLGFGANRAHRLRFTECLVENNNTKGFDRGWEAGGNKLVLTRDAVLERSRFLRNRGNGIWFDIGNENCTVRQCLIADNEDSGIFYEISYGLRAQDNVITGNGFAYNPGGWGAQAGISISSSPDCVLERNLIYGNREGFNFREQTRTTPRIGNKTAVAVWNHDQLIRRNIIGGNRDAQLWGWFDVKDNRHWPAGRGASDKSPQSGTETKPGDIAAAYGARDDKSQPKDLTLEKLSLRFLENVYFAEPGQKWFAWGPTWSKHQSYSSLIDFQQALGIDQASRVFNPAFANPQARDFRVPQAAMSELKGTYPQGQVPDVRLGVMGQ